jgi:hypothetical protein
LKNPPCAMGKNTPISRRFIISPFIRDCQIVCHNLWSASNLYCRDRASRLRLQNLVQARLVFIEVPRFGNAPVLCSNDVDITTVKWFSVSLRDPYEHHHKVLAAQDILDNDFSLFRSSESIEQTHCLVFAAVGTRTRMSTRNVPKYVRIEKRFDSLDGVNVHRRIEITGDLRFG